MKTAKWTLPIYTLSVAATAFIYGHLPSRIPIHWNIRGEVDNWGPRPMIFILAALPILLELLFWALPHIDPRRDAYKRHARAYAALRITIGMFLMAIHWVTVLYSLGTPISISLVVPMGVGILFMVIGNFMPLLKPNWFVGIRLPWTLASDEVWRATHRLGGWLFTGLGLATLVAAIMSPAAAFAVLIAGIVLLLGVTTVYSYVLYRRVHSN